MPDFIDEVMNFNPSDMGAFNEPVRNNYDANVYKANPRDAKSEDGVYRSKVKIIYNPIDPKDSIVHQATYFLKSADGGLLVRSRLGDVGRDPEAKSCKLFSTWKKLWFSGDESQKERAKELFQKNESDYVLVQILEDDNKPELVGKFMAMKLPKAVRVKLEAKVNPSKESKKVAYPVMDYVIGLELNMEVTPGPDDPSNPQRKQREISYDLCEFGDYAPIIKVDGTPLFDDEQLELIDNYVTAIKDSTTSKSEAKRKAAANQLQALRPEVKPLYQIAYDYVKENSFDLRAEQGWKEWDENTTKRVDQWVEIVLAGKNPENISYNDFKMGGNPLTEGVPINTSDPSEDKLGYPGQPGFLKEPEEAFGEKADDLPF